MFFTKSHKIGGYPLFFPASIVLYLLMFAIGGGAYLLFSSHADLADAINAKHNIHIEADTLRQSSDDLTRLARLYALTGNNVHKADYNRLLQIRNGKLPRPENYEHIYWHLSPNLREERHPDSDAESLESRLDNLPLQPDERDIIQTSHEISDNLAVIEMSVLSVVDSSGADSEAARQAAQALFSGTYQSYKEKVMVPLDDLMLFLDTRHSSSKDAISDKTKLYSTLLIAVSVLFLVLGASLFLTICKNILSPLAKTTASSLINLRILSKSLIVVAILFLCLIGYSFYTHLSLSKIAQDKNDIYITIDDMRQSSDDLTRLARLYAMTNNRDHAINYQTVLNIRNGDVQRPVNYHHVYWELPPKLREKRHPPGDFISLKSQLSSVPITDEERALIAKSQEESNRLARIEVAMFEVLGDGNTDDEEKQAARRELFSDKYINFKSDIMLPLDDLLYSIKKRYAEKQTALERMGRIAPFAYALAIVLFGILLLLTMRAVSHLLPK